MAGNESSSSHTSCASMIDCLQSFRACLPLQEILRKLKSPSSHNDSVIDGPLLMDHIRSLKLGLEFLERFLWILDHGNLNYLQIEHVLNDVRAEFRSLSRNQGLIPGLDSTYTNLREKMKSVPITLETGMKWRSYRLDDWKPVNEHLLSISGYLLSCSAGRIAPLTNEIEAITKDLELLQSLITYLEGAKVYIPHDKAEVLTPVFPFLGEAGGLLYFGLVDKMDEERGLLMKLRLSDVLNKTNVEDIYNAFFRTSRPFASRSSYPRTDPMGFLESFLGHLKQLVEGPPTSSGILDLTIRTQIGTLYLQFGSLRNSLIEINKRRYKKHDELERLRWESVDLAYEAEYVIDFYPVQESNRLLVQQSLSNIIGHAKLLETDHKTRICTHENNNNHQVAHHCVAETSADESSSKATDHIATAEIIGFEEQAKKIKEVLIRGPDRRDVILIAGMPGVGKTTLARKIYEDTSIHDFFHVQAWCSISQTYRKREVLHTILRDVLKSNEEADEPNELNSDEEVNKLNNVEEMNKLSDEEVIKLNDDEEINKLNSDEELNKLNSDEELNKLNKVDLADAKLLPTEVSEEDLAAQLYQSLKERRYLIIIDDLWDINAWNDLVRSLPDERWHSRIVITSRDKGLGSQIKNCRLHCLSQLSKALSWELFKRKAFEKETFSRKFEGVGKQIVESCKGLPLKIVIIAGVVANAEKSVSEWEKIAANLSSHIFECDAETSCKALIGLSYNYLPDHLKSCFLYFGAFLEDAKIPLWKLKALWIAEGFVQDTAGENKLEDVAEKYFMDLNSRSLVIATRERSEGGISACSIHDLLHDFCLLKAEEETFWKVVRANPRFYALTEDLDHRRLRVETKVTYPPTRSILSREPSIYHVRSLLNTQHHDSQDLTSNMPFITTHFKLLRVLDVASGFIPVSNSNLELLHHLRFLAITTDFIPSSIAKLWYLQYLLVNICKSGVSDVPASLWDMVNLRHLRVDHRKSLRLWIRRLYDWKTDRSDLMMVSLTANNKSSILGNLQVLSTPCFPSKEDAENLLRRAPKLRKLKCVFLECWERHHRRYEFPVLNFLHQLVSLNVSFQSSDYWGGFMDWHFPPNLKKLTLSGYVPLWKHIKEIGRNVQVLKLDEAHCGHYWKVDDGDFPNLKYLKLSRARLREWIASSEDCFPELEKLVIRNCWNLEEIPPCIGEIYTLRMVAIAGCRPSVVRSARQIREVQLDDEMQNEEFKLILE